MFSGVGEGPEQFYPVLRKGRGCQKFWTPCFPIIVAPLPVSHTKYFNNGSGPCLHGTHDEVGTTKHNPVSV